MYCRGWPQAHEVPHSIDERWRIASVGTAARPSCGSLAAWPSPEQRIVPRAGHSASSFDNEARRERYVLPLSLEYRRSTSDGRNFHHLGRDSPPSRGQGQRCQRYHRSVSPGDGHPDRIMSLSFCRATPTASSNGLGLTEDRLRLDRLPATSVASIFSAARARFASRGKKAVAGRLPLRFSLSGAG